MQCAEALPTHTCSLAPQRTNTRRYFGELAQAAKGVSSITPPSAAQLHKAYASLAPKQQASISELQAACAAAGIGAAVLPQVLQASAVATTGTIAVPEALLLLLTTGCDSFAAVVGGVFEVFGEQLAVPLFTRLLALLGSRDRDNLSVGLLEEVAGALEGQESVSYEGLAVVPSLWAKLAAH